MQVHEKYEESEKQTVAPDTQRQHSNAAPIHAEDPQAVIDLLATAEKEKGRRQWVAKLGLWIAVLFALAVVFPHTLGLIEVFVSLYIPAFIGYFLVVRYRNTATALAAVSDLRMVGPLIDRLRYGPMARRTRQMLKLALMRLLPRMKASDATLLSAGQKAELTRHLGRLATFQRDKDFQVVILRALEQIGDAQAIPVVERIVQRKPRSSGQELVHSAAVECLPFLLQRADEENVRNTLLRSANGFGGDSGELLQPAWGGEGTDPRLLLRGDPQERIPTNPE